MGRRGHSFIFSSSTPLVLLSALDISSAANKYYSFAGHHEQKNKKTTGEIKFSVVTIKQRIKLVLRHSLCK